MNGLVETSSLMIMFGMTNDEYSGDHTLPHLRNKIFEMNIVTKDERAAAKNREQQKRFKTKHKDDLTQTRKANYNRLIENGFTREEAIKRRDWSSGRITDAIMERMGI